MRGACQRPIAYTPNKTRNYESDLRLAAQYAMAGRPLLVGPLSVTVMVGLPIPKSMSKVKRQQALDGVILPTKKPDADNFAKVRSAQLRGVGR
jgi:Holliday junction resolvase RusA-like endonuclease